MRDPLHFRPPLLLDRAPFLLLLPPLLLDRAPVFLPAEVLPAATALAGVVVVVVLAVDLTGLRGRLLRPRPLPLLASSARIEASSSLAISSSRSTIPASGFTWGSSSGGGGWVVVVVWWRGEAEREV